MKKYLIKTSFNCDHEVEAAFYSIVDGILTFYAEDESVGMVIKDWKFFTVESTDKID